MIKEVAVCVAEGETTKRDCFAQTLGDEEILREIGIQMRLMCFKSIPSRIPSIFVTIRQR